MTSESVYREAARDIPVAATYDVLVAGGGAAGIAAALASARAGARTILVERYGSLGGMATGGLITLLLTLDDGRGTQTVAGVCEEMVRRLRDRGAAYAPAAAEWGDSSPDRVEHYRRWGLVWGRAPHVVRYSVAYDPEEFRAQANDMLDEAGVRLRFHTWVVAPLMEERRLQGVVVESKAGRQAIRAQVVVDATGDADLAAAVGEPFELERVNPWLWFRMGNVAEPDESIVSSEGKFFASLGGRFFKTIGPGRTLMPWGIADVLDRKIDPTDPDELSFAEVECRRRVMEVVDRLRATVPGCKDAYLADVAWQLGIYESRRVVGRYVLDRSDEGMSFADSIAFTGDWVKYGVTYEIPYRCLLPQSCENLLVAGRCISTTHAVHRATKEIPPCFATGEAAGLAAAMSVAANVPPSAVNVDELRRRLEQGGAILGPADGDRATTTGVIHGDD